MTGRTSSNNITKLKTGEIFVFGSNQSGNHKKFAAKTAMGWGAKWGQAAGLQGRTYGIPTKGKSMNKILSISQIKVYVDNFIKFAKENPDLIFLVTEIGCGASNYKPKDIAPLFQDAIEVKNIHLPERFWHKLKEN
jgi:hypothetical protein